MSMDCSRQVCCGFGRCTPHTNETTLGSHSYEYLRFEPEKYFPNASSNANRAEIRHNWDMLMPKGSGTVAVPNYREHPLLGNPITDDPLRKGPVFEASWTHAIHCVSDRSAKSSKICKFVVREQKSLTPISRVPQGCIPLSLICRYTKVNEPR